MSEGRTSSKKDVAHRSWVGRRYGGPPGAVVTLVKRAAARLAVDNGQALTEFAVVVPILLALVFGIVDFGRAINYQNDETHVANLAARYAAVGQLPTSGACGTTSNPAVTNVTTFITCEIGLDSPALAKAGAVSICLSIPSNTQFQPVTVKLTTSYQWLPILKLASSSISGTATQEIENPPSTTLVAGSQTTPCP